MNLKNDINIPQREFMEHFYNIKIKTRKTKKGFIEQYLDIHDMVIYDFCRGMMISNHPKIKTLNHNGQRYTWISCKYIIEQLPILRIKSKRGIVFRLRKLEFAGLLNRVVDKVPYGTGYINASFFAMGTRSDCLHYSKYEHTFTPQRNNCSPPKDEKTPENVNFDTDLGMNTCSDNNIVCKGTDKLEHDIKVLDRELGRDKGASDDIEDPLSDYDNIDNENEGFYKE